MRGDAVKQTGLASPGVLLLGGAVIGVLLALSHGYPAWKDWLRRSSAAASELTAEVQRAEWSVEHARMVADTLDARRRRLAALAPAVIRASSPALAAGSLADLVSELAATAGVRLASVQLRAESATPGAFEQVAIRASGVGDLRPVVEFLIALERGPPLLAVRELSITQPEPAASADLAQQLRVDLTVEALALSQDVR